jgi:PhnB protein
MMTHAQSPEPSRVGSEWKDKVLHARISIGDAELMGADIPNAEPMRSAYLTLRVESGAEAERVFAVLADGGQVLMPMVQTFFAPRFGEVRDRFGMNWMVLHERSGILLTGLLSFSDNIVFHSTLSHARSDHPCLYPAGSLSSKVSAARARWRRPEPGWPKQTPALLRPKHCLTGCHRSVRLA